jgi:hypothetical protein
MKVFKKTIKSNHIYREYVNVLNGLLQLSGKECELLSLLLEIEFTKPTILGKKSDLLSTDNRKALMEQTGVNKNNLSKYINILKHKRVILSDDNGHYINGMFMPKIDKDILDDGTKKEVSETMFILNLEDNEIK